MALEMEQLNKLEDVAIGDKIAKFCIERKMSGYIWLGLTKGGIAELEQRVLGSSHLECVILQVRDNNGKQISPS